MTLKGHTVPQSLLVMEEHSSCKDSWLTGVIVVENTVLTCALQFAKHITGFEYAMHIRWWARGFNSVFSVSFSSYPIH